jgi:acetyl-CoA acyltransferase 2
MAITAENLADQYKLSREAVDAFALQSQLRAKQAQAAGRFTDEIAPVVLSGKKGDVTIDRDEHPRPETTMESLAKLKPVFKKDGVVTAGNASGIVDGSASLVVASESYVNSKQLKPLAKMVGYAVSGCDPKVMGIGPVPAIRKLLERTGKKLEQIDLIEVNEAFSAQTLAVAAELNLPHEKLNVNGGAIAIGHPLAASGTRIIGHLIYELKRRGARYGLGSACIGGGQGIAILIENV